MAATLTLACSNYPWTLRYYDMNIYLWALHKMRISRISNIVWRVVSGMTLQMQAELQNKQLRRARSIADSGVLEGNLITQLQACQHTIFLQVPKSYLLYTGSEVPWPREWKFPPAFRKAGLLLQQIHNYQWNSSQRAAHPLPGWRFQSSWVPDV